ncbi:MAG: IclR family transcriptional regulator [Pseudorhodoplanes sp.]
MAGAQTVSRAFQLLRLVARRGCSGIQLVEAAGVMGLPHPTTHRLLKALIAEGAVLQNAATRRYHLGPASFELGLSSQYSSRIIDQCRPVLERLADATEDTIYLIMRSGFDAICLDRLEARTSVRAVTLDVGEWHPLGVGAAGAALLAALPDQEFEACIRHNAREFRLFRNLTENEVRASARAARQDGFGFNSENFTVGTSGIGIAIPASDGIPYLGISIAAVTDRISARTETLKRLLKTEALQIAQALSVRERYPARHA